MNTMHTPHMVRALALPGFLLALAFVLVLAVWSDHAPTLTMAISTVLLVVTLLALVVAVFWAAKRSDGRG